MGVGRRIRQARDARGLSLAEVSSRTKIPVRLLEALEAEQYERLPTGIFGRGYVRAAAEAVGLDGARMSADYRDEIEPAPVRAIPAAMAFQPESVPRLHLAPDRIFPAWRVPSRALLGIAAAAAAVLLIAWSLSNRDDAASAAFAPASSTASEPSGSAAPAAVGTSGGIQPAATTSAPGKPQPIELSLEATRPCWVTLTADGERVIYRLLAPGDRATVRVNDRALLRTGDAGALRISVNGHPARAAGASGAVRTLEITPTNYQTVLP